MCPPGTDSSAARLPDKRRPSSCLQLAQEDSGKARVLRATGGLVQEVTEHEQLVYGTRALDREPEKDDMGVKEKVALRSPLNYRHGARARNGREGAASSQPHTGYTSRKERSVKQRLSFEGQWLPSHCAVRFDLLFLQTPPSPPCLEWRGFNALFTFSLAPSIVC